MMPPFFFPALSLACTGVSLVIFGLSIGTRSCRVIATCAFSLGASVASLILTITAAVLR